ncbi:MAG TPA: transcription antitermination factor NusB [Marmoricola sp.]|nr:transcription antitermination factor NusB [Marmoricola sp.]
MTSDPRSPRARRPGGRRPRLAPRVDPARLAAFEVLHGVTTEDAYANLLLPARLRAHSLEGRDAAFATELVSGTLRRQGTYDAVLASCVKRPLERMDPGVLDVLRLGAHQLLSMRVPVHAAVATSVDLCRAKASHGAAGLVNAVLRRVGEKPLDNWVRLVAPDPASDPHGFAAVSQSHPRWVVEELAAALGERADELAELLAADNDPPPVTLVARPGLCSREELVAAGGEPTSLSPFGVRLPGGDPGALPAVKEGRAGVQDEGSQVVAWAIGVVPVEGRDERWLDLCAGPGGKSALLGGLAAQCGARLLAVERQPHRAELVRRSVAGLPASAVGVVAADGTQPVWAPGQFDRVLVDAPCSGLGALRRRPESRWRRTLRDLDDLVPLQLRLLESALDAVRPGGVVAYVTCSPVLRETTGVVTEVLGRRGDVELLDASAVLPDVPDAAASVPGTMQLWPHRHGTDAMFLALLRRS